jgi:hypothetical protein
MNSHERDIPYCEALAEVERRLKRLEDEHKAIIAAKGLHGEELKRALKEAEKTSGERVRN